TVRDLHPPAPKIRSSVGEGREHDHASRDLHRSRMCSDNIVELAANVVMDVVIGSGEVEVESWHDGTHSHSQPHFRLRTCLTRIGAPELKLSLTLMPPIRVSRNVMQCLSCVIDVHELESVSPGGQMVGIVRIGIVT